MKKQAQVSPPWIPCLESFLLGISCRTATVSVLVGDLGGVHVDGVGAILVHSLRICPVGTLGLRVSRRVARKVRVCRHKHPYNLSRAASEKERGKNEGEETGSHGELLNGFCAERLHPIFLHVECSKL